jgi:hypothetical protein
MMLSRNLVKNLKRYELYSNVDNENILYAMSKEEYENKMNIIENYDNQEENVPDEYKVNVFPLVNFKLFGFSIGPYDIIGDSTISIPINKLHWIFVCRSYEL